MQTTRILFGVVLFLSAILLPLSVTCSLVVLGFFLYPHFWEAVVISAFIEFIYRGEGSDIFGSHLPLAALILTLFVVVEIFRTFIRERTY